MKGLILKATKRDLLGKKTKILRSQGITPTHLFGHNLESLSLQCDTADLKQIIAQAGKTRLLSLKVDADKQSRSVFIREIQRDRISGQLIHVDLYQIQKKEKIKVDIPIVLAGEAPALKEKGHTLTHGVTSLSIECLPDKLPPQIDVDLSILEEKEQSIYVRDIILDLDITLITDPDQMVVKVGTVHIERLVEEMAEEEAMAEGQAEAPTGEEKPEKESTE